MQLKDFLTFICVLPLLILASKIFKQIRALSKYKKLKQRIANDFINYEDIYSITPREFELWCPVFLKKMGYDDIKVSDEGPDGGKDIICKMNGNIVYVECKKYVNDYLAPRKVDVPIVKKLVGAMVRDTVQYGMVITTGVILESARQFVDSLDNNISVLLIDGGNLVSLYNGKKDIRRLSPLFNE